jgi:hypothetical protein
MASMVEDTQVHKDSTKCDSMLAFSRQSGNFMFAVDLLRGIHFCLHNIAQGKDYCPNSECQRQTAII